MSDKHECDGPACQEAADRAVKKVFAILGVDIDVPKEVEEFREDLRFGRTIRKLSERSMLVAVGAVTLALFAALGAGILSKFAGGH